MVCLGSRRKTIYAKHSGRMDLRAGVSCDLSGYHNGTMTSSIAAAARARHPAQRKPCHLVESRPARTVACFAVPGLVLGHRLDFVD